MAASSRKSIGLMLLPIIYLRAADKVLNISSLVSSMPKFLKRFRREVVDSLVVFVTNR